MIHVTVSQAVRSEDAEQWKKAMELEMESMKENVFTIVTLPEGKKVVGSWWVHTVKDKPDREMPYKARFVAKGFTQVEGTDYMETYSPTAKMATIRMLMQLAVQKNMIIHQLDNILKCTYRLRSICTSTPRFYGRNL